MGYLRLMKPRNWIVREHLFNELNDSISVSERGTKSSQHISSTATLRVLYCCMAGIGRVNWSTRNKKVSPPERQFSEIVSLCSRHANPCFIG